MNPPIYSGKSHFVPGMTAFGYYDYDTQFQNDADKVVNFVASRLGYEIVDVELSIKQIYTAFEEAITTYGNEVYSFKLRDNYLTLEGTPTNQYLNNAVITPNLNTIFRLSEQYGDAAGVGSQPWESGSVDVKAGIQDYDLGIWATNNGYNAKDIRIQRVFWYEPPVYGGPYDTNGVVGTYTGDPSLEFGSVNASMYGDTNWYLLQPLNFDIANMQEIEMSRTIRRSNYSFEMHGSRVKILPIPTYNTKLWFQFTSNDVANANSIDTSCYSGSDGTYSKINSVLNAPFKNPIYSQLNSISRIWVYEYTLALCMETLGFIRGKYSQVPIPGDNVTLNSGDLMSQGNKLKDMLLDKLKTYLDETSRKAQLERRSMEADFIASETKHIPMVIYVG